MLVGIFIINASGHLNPLYHNIRIVKLNKLNANELLLE